MPNIGELLGDHRLKTAGIARERHLDSGEIVIQEGSDDRVVYLIQRGYVRVTERVELEDRRHIQPGICDLGANEVFGELSLFDPGPRLATVMTLKPCDLLVFDARALAGYFDQHPDFGYQVLKELFRVLSSRLRQTDRRVGALFAWGLKAHGIDKHL
jgi:CRP/FNR family cyclic AMP-dependent transcriptional regulator